ncbi:protein of unknown function (plasmid) [Candidatus Methylocalor cossyra]|uniref:Reverse transcriptase domain-containing protein n=1 Tax=Candidatus Methylocalor cossyra TaxID=3108543 RepID=A0ABM9NN65_9GAMM
MKRVLEPKLEPVFHRDSWVSAGARRMMRLPWSGGASWEYDWVVEFDIKGLFDNIDHELLLRAVRKHCQIPWVLRMSSAGSRHLGNYGWPTGQSGRRARRKAVS